MPVEQIGNALIAEAYFTIGGLVAAGLTVTCDVDKLETDGTYTALVTGAAATEGRNGIYFYILASGSVDVRAVYNFVFKTADACDQQNIVAAWTAGQAWVENVDAASSTLATAIALATAQADLDNPSQYKADVSALATSAALAIVNGIVDAILLDTGTDGVLIADDAITSDAYDESTAFPLKADDSGDTYVARTGADSDTMETLSDQIETLRTILARSSVAGSIDANELTLIRGDSYDSDTDNAIEGLGDISNRINLWVVVKKSTALTDLQATIFAEETAGITRLNGVAYTTTGHSIITVSDEVAGDLRWQLDEVVTNALTPGLYFYDIQTLDNAGAVKTWRQVKQFTVLPDVARVIV